ncbi:hypothetical protein NBH15_03715 [Parabacteroides sp. W1-Q-101]|uniref:hypothetical protein n=1 Tax=Parabacteroides caeci TaxID=2949650 RepID=UPI00202EA8EE|nr:hypothetical protein [Parabacteroides sp. W1-Q-101]MCM0717377.1 hypothetical protein [Parabacteroides sp. W1-Q-101]
MSIVTVQKPDSLSMSGNMKDLILQSADPVLVKLSVGGQTILEEAYYPGNGNLIHVDFREVAESYLSFTLPSSDVFIQPRLAAEFSVTYDSETYTFSCIKSGKLNLNESASQFLAGNFLTWQPTQKAVTYYSPEWLTYYATDDCSVRLRAYWEDGTNTSITLSTQSRGTCVTYNLQYAVIYGKFTPKRPMYYDVWVENASGARLSYVQRYLASEKQGEDENWYLFENSLGGIDSLRAYGALKDDPEYTHNLASFGDESEEYRIDSNRLLTRNTGMLTPEEARWLQDMFVARRKYVYTLSGLYRIVFTSSDAKTDSANPPTSYSFTYRLADNRPYLDIQRRTDLPENLVIPVPTGETFFLPPRLAEFPKPSLSPDLLIPVQEPHTEVWGATTTGQIHDKVLNDLITELEGLDLNTSQGGTGIETIKSTDTITVPSDNNVYTALRAKNEDEKRLRKDIEDFALELINFLKGTKFGEFIPGILTGKGGMIDAFGNGELESLIIRRFLEVPEIRFNRAEVFTGISWNAPGGGIIESVDTVNRIARLKLEDGEFGAVAVGDICMGIFHSLTSSENATEDKDDSKGVFTFAGFFTAYFTVTEILDKENQTFKYQLRPSSASYPHEFHPCEAMHFVAYGNFTNKDRQTSNYATRTYTRYLYHVDGWEFEKRQIAAQFGDLTNLSVHGYNMTGYSIFLNNIYMTGVINQMSADGTSVERVPFFKGAWTQGEYAYYDEVTYNGSSWLCVNPDGTTSEPVDGNPDWFKRVSKGEDGKDGTSAEAVGEWDPNRSYVKGNIVRSDGASYIANRDNQGVKPRKNPGGYLTTGGKYLTTGGKRLYTGDPNHPWQLLSEDGLPGSPGLPGPKGDDGIQYYTWLKYADDAQGNGMSDLPAGKKYMGLAVNQTSPTESNDPNDYNWSLIEGEGVPGKPGEDGKTLYTWVRYADDAQGNGMSNNPDGKKYVGLAYNKETETESNNPSDYKWSKIEGDPGEAGLNYITEPYSPYREYNQRDLVSFNGGKIFCKKKNTGQTPVPFLSTGGKYLKTGGSYLLYKPLTPETINSEYWDIFIPPTVIEPVEQEFTTYHTSISKPPRPILTGNSLGWSQTIMTGARWKSTKKAISDAAGTWSDPVQYSAEDGKPGNDATAYWLVSPVTNIVFNTVGNPTPAAFTVLAKQQTGTGTVQASDRFYLACRKSVTGTSAWEQHVAPVKGSSINVTVIAGIKAYSIRMYEKQSDAQAWNSNYVDEVGVSVIRDGLDGERGATGSMPRSCGFYDQNKAPYFWNEQYRDIVLYGFNNAVYVFQVRNYSPGKGVTVPPTSQDGDANWEVANKQIFVAMDTALIDGANIAEFQFKNKKMQSQDVDPSTGEPNLLLDGKTGEIIAHNGIFKGSIGTPFVWEELVNGQTINVTKNFNIIAMNIGSTTNIKLPVDSKYNGTNFQIANPPTISKLSWNVVVSLTNNGKIWNTGETYDEYKTSINVKPGKICRLIAVGKDNEAVNWYCDNYYELTH